MPTARQIEAKLKKEKAQLKRDIVSFVMEAVLSVLHESRLYGSSLWPKNGFKIGYTGTEKLDTITIGIRIVDDSEYKKVRFNIWGKEARVLKQHKQLVAIFDQTIYNDIYFYPEYPDHLDELAAHYHEGYIMDMLDFRFTLNN